MKKTAEEIQQFYYGKLDAFSSLGLSKEAASYLIQADGVKQQIADEFIKQAWGPLGALGGVLAKGLARGGSFLATRGGALARKATPLAGQTATSGQRFQGALGRLGTRAGSGLISGASNIQRRGLLPAFGGGLAEAGKGFMFAGGKGLGGTIGKGLFGLQTASTLGSIMNNNGNYVSNNPYYK